MKVWELYYITKFSSKGEIVFGNIYFCCINPLSASPRKWPNTLKQFVDKLLANCLCVFDHFVKVALKGLMFTVYESGLQLINQNHFDILLFKRSIKN